MTIEDWRSTPLILGLNFSELSFAVLVSVAAYVLMRLALRLALRMLNQLTQNGARRALVPISSILGSTKRGLMVLTAVLIGIGTLALPADWSSRVSHLWFLTLLLQVALWLSLAVSIGLQRYFDRHADSTKPETVAQRSASATLLSWALQTLLWTVALLAILSNLGVNITAFVASLGVGGIAVALAVQNILGDLFASLAIAIDKPFEVGDFIVVSSASGTVEAVGLKTTRIRSINGEQIVMSNTDLLKQTISNFKRMSTRRIAFSFGVTYDTTAEQAEMIPPLVRRIIEQNDQLLFDRAHLKSFGASSLDFEVVFKVLVPEYGVYMDMQQSINLQLMRELKALGVEFAFPTQTVHIVRPSARIDRQSGVIAAPADARPMSPS